PEEIIAKIDPREAEIQKKGAAYGLNSALERASDDIERRYAEEAAKHAELELRDLKETNRRMTGAIPETDIRKAELEYSRSILAIEKATHDMKVATLEAGAKRAEVKMAELSIDRRTIR